GGRVGGGGGGGGVGGRVGGGGGSGGGEVDLGEGSSQSRYHGYTTGAHRIDAAIGQANAYHGHASDLLLSQLAVRMPMRTANPATSGGAATRSSAANTGALNRKLWTYVYRSRFLGHGGGYQH